jgi:sulfur relay (sulfurtransferase) complex TusBCD TusD component (DsrE family)
VAAIRNRLDCRIDATLCRVRLDTADNTPNVANHFSITMKLGIVISTPDPESAFNALRLANYSVKQGDQVRIFLLGAGVEIDRIEHPHFDVRAQAEALIAAGGRIYACGTCLKLRHSEGSEICPLSTMHDLYEIVRDSDRVLTF